MMNAEIVHVHLTLISSGCTYCSSEVHRFHLLHHFIFLSKTFFLLFNMCTFFLLK